MKKWPEFNMLKHILLQRLDFGIFNQYCLSKPLQCLILAFLSCLWTHYFTGSNKLSPPLFVKEEKTVKKNIATIFLPSFNVVIVWLASFSNSFSISFSSVDSLICTGAGVFLVLVWTEWDWWRSYVTGWIRFSLISSVNILSSMSSG